MSRKFFNFSIIFLKIGPLRPRRRFSLAKQEKVWHNKYSVKRCPPESISRSAQAHNFIFGDVPKRLKGPHSKSSCTRGNLHPANPCSYWLFSYMERWQRENFFPTFFPSSRNQLDFAGTLFCYGISTLNGDRAKHPKLNSAIIWHLPVDYRWRVVRVVEGAGLENQCTFLVPRVRTPHSPPESNNESPERRSLF